MGLLAVYGTCLLPPSSPLPSLVVDRCHDLLKQLIRDTHPGSVIEQDDVSVILIGAHGHKVLQVYGITVADNVLVTHLHLLHQRKGISVS